MTTIDQKRQKFVELAEKRVNKAIKSIRLVGNLSNKHFYSYDDKDVRQILRALEDEISLTRNRFKDVKLKEETEFRLL